MSKISILAIFLLFHTISFTQNGSISGKIVDDTGEGIIAVNIVLDNTTYTAFTDIDGVYKIDNVVPGTYNLSCTFVGFSEISESITVKANENLIRNYTLTPDNTQLNESVVIGYGTSNSKDLTGSTKLIKEKDFTAGNVTTPEQLITGKVAGVQITSNDGAPGSGSRIRIRGGTSLNASNDPLIVIDGVPVDNEGISGAANALNLINPADIANMVILKDASAAAIYGSRGANGVILITTKQGQANADKMNINLQQKFALSIVGKYADVLTGDQLRTVIQENGTQDQLDLLGEENTDWQSLIYRNAFINETNLSFSGGIAKLPYRLSIGYKHEEGVLKRHKLDRTSVGLNLNPKLLNDHLQVSVNTKLSLSDNFFANQGAIGAAVSFDPTQPVNTDSEALGGYFEWLNPNSGAPSNLAGKNPVGLLDQREDESNVMRFIGNLKLDYEIPSIPNLHIVANLGGDFSNSDGSVFVPAEAASSFFQGGEQSQYEQTKSNRLLDTYLNYSKEWTKSNLDLTAGYSYQRWLRESPSFPLLNAAGDTITPAQIPFKTENALISFYGRAKFSLHDKYLLTATLRRDGSSRFNPNERWGIFPSFAAAWRISEENFLKDSKLFSYLKLRAGFGITGQQDIGNDYPYLANYTFSTSTAQYQFGEQFLTLLRPDGFDFNIKWEETASTNIGLDYGFKNNKVFGSIDWYHKSTIDLLAVVDVPAGVNFTNEILTNVGSITNTGVEFEMSIAAITKKESNLTLGFNLTANRNEITKLSEVIDTTSVGILTGGISGGIGNNAQIHAVGSASSSFYLYEQVYDVSGNPVEGEVVDRNNDGIINGDDRYISQNPNPDVFLGFFTNYAYKNWTAGLALRSELGKYVYNNVNSERGFFEAIPNQDFINNLNSSFSESGFITRTNEQLLSDFYLEKANFLRLDYISLGHDFGKIMKDRAKLNVGFTINNVFVISNYSGIDPEISSGLDQNIYPRPRIYSLNININL